MSIEDTEGGSRVTEADMRDQEAEDRGRDLQQEEGMNGKGTIEAGSADREVGVKLVITAETTETGTMRGGMIGEIGAIEEEIGDEVEGGVEAEVVTMTVLDAISMVRSARAIEDITTIDGLHQNPDLTSRHLRRRR